MARHDPGGKVRRPMPLGMRGGAVFAGDRDQYRPLLWREWGRENARRWLFIGMNPSTADAMLNDPTVAAEIRICQRFGITAYRKCNISDYRATDPKELKYAHPIASGENLPTILQEARQADRVILAFGANTLLRPLAEQTVASLRVLGVTLYCLWVNKDGSPKHPLYMRADIKPVEWKGWAYGPDSYQGSAETVEPRGPGDL